MKTKLAHVHQNRAIWWCDLCILLYMSMTVNLSTNRSLICMYHKSHITMAFSPLQISCEMVAKTFKFVLFDSSTTHSPGKDWFWISKLPQLRPIAATITFELPSAIFLFIKHTNFIISPPSCNFLCSVCAFEFGCFVWSCLPVAVIVVIMIAAFRYTHSVNQANIRIWCSVFMIRNWLSVCLN